MFPRPCLRIVTLLSLSAGCVAAAGCSTVSSEFHNTTTMVPVEPASLSRLYLYSFLDLSSHAIGTEMIEEISRQLAAEMGSRGIVTEEFTYAADPLRPATQTGWTTERVPTGAVIARNREREREFGARYRLIVLPEATVSVGASRTYRIRWRVEDSRTGRPVWFTTSRGEHTNLIHENENAEARARAVVQGLITEMVSSGFLPDPGAPARPDSASAPSSGASGPAALRARTPGPVAPGAPSSAARAREAA